MKATDILKAVGEVDEEVIANAKKNQKSNKKVLIAVGTIVACAVFGCIGAIILNMPKNNVVEEPTAVEYKEQSIDPVVAFADEPIGFVERKNISNTNNTNAYWNMTPQTKKTSMLNIYSENYLEINNLLSTIINGNLNDEQVSEQKAKIYEIVNRHENEEQRENLKGLVDYIFSYLETTGKKDDLSKTRNYYANMVRGEYGDLSDEQLNQIITLRLTRFYPKKSYPYSEAKIAGIIDDSYEKLTIDTVRTIIDDSKGKTDRLYYIKSECQKIQRYADVVFDSSSFNVNYDDYVIYYSNNNHDIIKIKGNTVYFYQIDDNENIINEEVLYPAK